MPISIHSNRISVWYSRENIFLCLSLNGCVTRSESANLSESLFLKWIPVFYHGNKWWGRKSVFVSCSSSDQGQSSSLSPLRCQLNPQNTSGHILDKWKGGSLIFTRSLELGRGKIMHWCKEHLKMWEESD